MLNISMNNLDPVEPGPMPPGAELTFLLPLVWVYLFSYHRVRRSQLVHKRRAFAMIGGALLVPIVLVTLSPPYPLSLHAHKIIFEISTIAFVVAMAVHAYRVRGRHHFLKIFVIGLAYGMILENGGILMGFFSEEGYVGYLPLPFIPAPVCTLAGWCTVFYTCSTIVEELVPRERRRQMSPLSLGALATVVALSLDVQLDPVATHLTWWTWHPSLARETAFVGVPLINFLAWISAVFPFATYWFWMERCETWTNEQSTRRLALALPGILAAASAMVLILGFCLTGGPDSPTMLLFRRGMADTLSFWP